MTDTKFWEDAFMREMMTIRTISDNIPSMSDPAEQENALEKYKEHLRNAEKSRLGFVTETRLIKEKDKRRQHQSKLEQIDTELKTLNDHFRTIQADLKRDEVMPNGTNVLKEAKYIQDKTHAALINIKGLISESKQVGLETLGTLEENRHAIQKIDKHNDQINSKLAKSEKLIKKFRRGMFWIR